MKKLVDSLKTAFLFLVLQTVFLLGTVFFAALYSFGQNWEPDTGSSLFFHFQGHLAQPGFLLFTAASSAFLVFRISRKSFPAFLLFTLTIIVSFFLPVPGFSAADARLMEEAIIPVNSRNSVYVFPTEARSPGSLILADPASSESSLDYLPTAEIQGTTLRGHSRTAEPQKAEREISLSSSNPFAEMIYLSSRSLKPVIQQLRNYYYYIRQARQVSQFLFSAAIFPYILLLAANSVFLHATRWQVANLVFYIFDVILFILFSSIAILEWQNLYPLFIRGTAMAEALPALVLSLYPAAIGLLNILVNKTAEAQTL